MAVIHIDQSQTTTYEINADNNIYIVDPGIYIYPASGAVMHVMAGATGNRIEVNGALWGDDTLVALSVQGDDTRVVIEKTGSVVGWYGISAFDVSIDIINRGDISGDSVGIALNFVEGRLINHGHISAGPGATVVSQYATSGRFTVENHGTLSGYQAMFLEGPDTTVRLGKTSEIHGVAGIRVQSQAGQVANALNEGLISSATSFAYSGGAGEDTFTNRGSVYGDILLGAGDDRFTDKGTFVGDLEGGGGDDLFILRSAVAITEANGGGIDTVRIGKSYILSDEVENLLATGRKGIDLTGNDESNVIKGNRGDNRIEGGASVDTLTGGGGKDLFAYEKNDGMDTITDFKHGQDRIRIEGFTQYTTFADLDIVKSGNDVRISFADENGADFITVENQKVGDFDKGDFLFG